MPRVDPEARRAYQRAYQERRRAEMAEYQRAYSAANSAKKVENARRWRLNNPLAAKALRINEKARRRGMAGRITAEDWGFLLRRYDSLCAYCGERQATTADHVIPASRGGLNTIGNILPACLRCNASKGNRFVMEWKVSRA